MGKIKPENEAKSVTYTMTTKIVVSVVREVNRMVAETTKNQPFQQKWQDIDILIKHTRDCTETNARNQPTEVVWLPLRKDPNQQATLGHMYMHDLISRSLSSQLQWMIWGLGINETSYCIVSTKLQVFPRAQPSDRLQMHPPLVASNVFLHV